jgi:hypothetical protein
LHDLLLIFKEIITEPVIGIYLSNEENNKESEISFGGANPRFVENKTIERVEVVSEKDWLVKLNGIKVQGVNFESEEIHVNFSANIDTGSTSIVMSKGLFC